MVYLLGFFLGLDLQVNFGILNRQTNGFCSILTLIQHFSPFYIGPKTAIRVRNQGLFSSFLFFMYPPTRPSSACEPLILDMEVHSVYMARSLQQLYCCLLCPRAYKLDASESLRIGCCEPVQGGDIRFAVPTLEVA